MIIHHIQNHEALTMQYIIKKKCFFFFFQPVFETIRVSKTPTPQRRDIHVPRVITNGRRVLVDQTVKRKDKM